MKVSTEQLLQMIGQLFVENQVLGKQVELHIEGIKNHMQEEHPERIVDPRGAPDEGEKS